MDDLKISHVSKAVVQNVLKILEKRYGSLVTAVGPKFDYLGINMDFSKRGLLIVDMTEMTGKIIQSCVDMPGEAVTPAANHLFSVNEQCDKLSDEAAQRFHTLVAKLLFVCKRARPDIQVAVAFLTTRGKGPDSDDWKKLARVIKYLRHTKDMVLTLGWDDSSTVRVPIDAAFAVHPDMQSHTGYTMTVGRGHFQSSSTKQRMNTRSSTEAELVAVNDALPQVIWTRHFMEAQGYEVRDMVVYQDNLSAMLLATKGKASSGKRMRHLDIRYFFVKDRIDSREVRMEYKTTTDLTADYFTKPLQGEAFQQFCDRVMGIQ